MKYNLITVEFQHGFLLSLLFQSLNLERLYVFTLNFVKKKCVLHTKTFAFSAMTRVLQLKRNHMLI